MGGLNFTVRKKGVLPWNEKKCHCLQDVCMKNSLACCWSDCWIIQNISVPKKEGLLGRQIAHCYHCTMNGHLHFLGRDVASKTMEGEGWYQRCFWYSYSLRYKIFPIWISTLKRSLITEDTTLSFFQGWHIISGYFKSPWNYFWQKFS